jgi:hypothetical protein
MILAIERTYEKQNSMAKLIIAESPSTMCGIGFVSLGCSTKITNEDQ